MINVLMALDLIQKLKGRYAKNWYRWKGTKTDKEEEKEASVSSPDCDPMIHRPIPKNFVSPVL